MSKRRYRFGMDYLGTRPLWVRSSRRDGETGVIVPARMVIRDTHQEWDVQELWGRFMARAVQALNDADQAVTDAKDTMERIDAALQGKPDAEG